MRFRGRSFEPPSAGKSLSISKSIPGFGEWRACQSVSILAELFSVKRRQADHLHVASASLLFTPRKDKHRRLRDRFVSLPDAGQRPGTITKTLPPSPSPPRCQGHSRTPLAPVGSTVSVAPSGRRRRAQPQASREVAYARRLRREHPWSASPWRGRKSWPCSACARRRQLRAWQ